MRKGLATIGAVALLGVAAVLVTRQPGLDVEVLDVGGFTDPMPIWMPFRVTLGIGNPGRTPVVISRIEIEPDLDGFDEAFSGAGILSPPLRIDPGSRASYQAAVTLLNANSLPEGTYHLTFRVRIDLGDRVRRFEFPAEFDYVREPTGRVLHPGY